RMEPIDDLEGLRTLLRGLLDRKLVAYLTPEGRRGSVVTHGFHSAQELERVQQQYGRSAVDEEVVAVHTTNRPPEPANDGAVADPRDQVAGGLAEIVALRDQLSSLQSTVADLVAQVRQIKEGLGLS